MKEIKREQPQSQPSLWEKRKDAAITVEASFVMALVLFVCGALILQGFYVHERNTGMLILMDALEQIQTERAEPDTVEASRNWANRALNSYYRCSGGRI